jgi:hypothetical protein
MTFVNSLVVPGEDHTNSLEGGNYVVRNKNSIYYIFLLKVQA